jgi:flagellar basal-body rod protein FlgG
MHLDMARLDRVGTNLVNVQTAGFKRELDAAAAAGRMDLRPGALRATNRPLDLALAGNGWFEVATPQGTAYTRQGDFRLDAQGRLVTAQGHAVMGLGGEILLAPSTPVIDAQGRIFESAAAREPLAQLKVVVIDSKASVQRLGGGLVRVAAAPVVASADAAGVRQGFLETSNVDPAREMVDLTRTLRHFESLQKITSGYDDLIGSAIRRLGEAN